MRRRWVGGVGLGVAATAALAVSTLASTIAATPAVAEVARPNPVLVSVHLDYVRPLRSASGQQTADLAPLDPAVSAQAVSDERYLHYRTGGDLGGFVLAPIGASASSSGGRAIVGEGRTLSQIPQYGQAAEGVVRSFAFIGSGQGSGAATQNGRTQVPGLGIPPQLPQPSNSNSVPPPNEGFGGRPGGSSEGGTQPSGAERPVGGSGGGKTGGGPGGGKESGGESGKSGGKSGGKAKPHSGGKQPPPVTTPTTTPQVTPPPGGGGEGGPTGGGPSGGASCGTIGLAITSDHASCRIYAVNMEPGQSGSETMTVRDDAGVPVTLSLRAAGDENRLWQDLRLGVWQAGTPAPDPLPALLWWTTQDNTLTTLQPAESVSYEVELYLPPSAGNEDQGKTALIDLTWSAHQ